MFLLVLEGDQTTVTVFECAELEAPGNDLCSLVEGSSVLFFSELPTAVVPAPSEYLHGSQPWALPSGPTPKPEPQHPAPTHYGGQQANSRLKSVVKQ